MPLPTAIIHCPDCGVECNCVANCFAEMPSSYPGNYHSHQKGGRGCLERQIWNLKKQLSKEATGKKYLVRLVLAGWFQTARVVATAMDQSKKLHEPHRYRQ